MDDKNKRYYWIRLKTDFFEQKTIDFLLSQKNGCEYVVLYQMLCLSTANTNGTLVTNINDMLIPYDVNKIVRDTKYFDFDTVSIALELFKKLGLIYEEQDGILKISNYEAMVGSEAGNANAQRQKKFRERKKLELQNVTNSNASNVTESVMENNEEIRDKRLDIKSIDNKEIIDLEKETTTNVVVKKKQQKFVKPTAEQIDEYCRELDVRFDSAKFIDYYESKGWLVGEAPMKNWKATVRNWLRQEKKLVNQSERDSTLDGLF